MIVTGSASQSVAPMVLYWKGSLKNLA